MTKVTGHGSIRKFKNGAAGVLALSTLFLGVSQVSANETQQAPQTETSATKTATPSEEKNLPEMPPEEKNLPEADNTPATTPTTDNTEVLKETGVEKKENVDAPKEAKKDVAKQEKQSEQPLTVDSAIKELKDAGLEVVVGKEIVTTSPQETAKALEGLKQQVTKALDAKQELDIAFLDLKEKAKNAGILTKEGKTLTFDTAKEAKENLEKQAKEVNQLIETLDKEHEKLLNLAKEAQKAGIAIAVTPALKADSVEDATAAISAQIDKLNALIKSVEENKTLIDSVTNKAKEVGVALEGEIVIDSKVGEETKLTEKVSNALTGLEVATKVQKTTKEELAKLIEEARAKGLDISISGEKKILVSKAQEELESVRTKINEGLANDTKKMNDYKLAVQNAKNANRLLEGSTATKEGDVYKQTLSIQSAGTGGTVNINASGSADIVSLELLDPNGSKIESVKTLADLNAYKAFDKKGTYTVNYTFKAKDNTAGSVTSKATTNGIEGVIGSAQGTITLTTKAPLVTNKENQVAPLTIAHVYDYSSSYAGKLKDSLRLSKKIIEANSPESKHIFLGYEQNYDTTYAANMADTVGVNGFASKLLSKDQALSLIDKLLKINAPSEKDPTYTNYPAYFQGVADTFGEFRYKDASVTPDRFGRAMKPFEDIIEKFTKPTDTVSVIQYTDGWMLGYRPDGKPTETSEEIDKTFADWAKKRAKTFMSVINRNQVTNEDTNSLRSIQQMESVGHPNIYDMTGKDKDVAEQEIIKQFLETATEKITTKKGENQTVKVTIGGNGVTVTKAVLKGATTKELAIKDGKVDFSEKLADGSWTVEFEATGNGKLTAVVSVDGKEVGKKDVEIKSTEGVKGSSASKTDSINAIVFPKLPTFTPVTVENLTILAKNVRLGKVETDIHPVTIEKELNPVTFKETVSPIKEVTPTPKEAPKAQLPNTGESNNSLVQAAGLGLGVVGLIGLAGATKKKRRLIK